MGNLSWKAKQFVRKLLPITLILAAVYGGYSMYRKGTFRRGIGPAMGSVLKHIPYFGSRFKHYGQSKSYSYKSGSKSYKRRGKAYRRGKYRKGKKARRHRRGRRR